MTAVARNDGRGVLEERQILSDWLSVKLGGPSYRLERAVSVEHIYRGPQPGHPSNLAGIELHAEPAEQLSLVWCAELSEDAAREDRHGLVRAVAMAAVDTLLTRDYHPYRGCAISVRGLSWHPVMSSQGALYRATCGALEQLVTDARWQLVPGDPGNRGDGADSVDDGGRGKPWETGG